jgi:hypothetical protein
MLHSIDGRRRRYKYLRSGSPEGKKGHGGRVEGHHIEDELSADDRVTSTKSSIGQWQISTPASQTAQSGNKIERRSGTRHQLVDDALDANSKFPSTKDRENQTESGRSFGYF